MIWNGAYEIKRAGEVISSVSRIKSKSLMAIHFLIYSGLLELFLHHCVSLF